MDGSEISVDTVAARLEATVSDQFDADAWAVETDPPDRVTVQLPDRKLAVHRRDGPDGVAHWTLELAADGATVSKFGPFDKIEDLLEKVTALLDSDVFYTVCCDG